jgi:DNA ligase (NAD+)
MLVDFSGGKIGGSISRRTNYLIMKAVGSGSSKEKKAIELGIKIMTISQLETFLQ